MRLPSFLSRRDPRSDAVGPDDRARAADHGERAEAAATTDGGVRVVVTDRALHVGAVRVPWERVARATWDDEEGALVVVGSPGPAEPAQRLVLRLTDAPRLLETVRVAVTSTVVVSRRLESPVHGGAWATARRAPGDDEVRWVVVFDPGHDPTDPARRAWADAVLAELRGSLGV